MSKNVIALNDVRSKLKISISRSNECKDKIIQLIEWAVSWNDDLSEGDQIFAFIRETENIAFALDRNDNKSKLRKPNFIVIKMPDTDRFFKGLHIDFSFTESGNDEFSKYLIQREDNPTRWVLTCKDLDKLTFDDLKTLFLVAYENKL